MAPCSLFWSLWIPIWSVKTLQKLIEASVASAGSMCDQWSGSADKQLHTSHSGSLIHWSVIICYLSRSNEREWLQRLEPCGILIPHRWSVNTWVSRHSSLSFCYVKKKKKKKRLQNRRRLKKSVWGQTRCTASVCIIQGERLRSQHISDAPRSVWINQRRVRRRRC